MAAELARMNDDYSRAAELAQNAVSVDSKDCRDHVWLGQILGAVGRLEQAEKTLQRAVALFSTESATWVALVQFQARTNKLDKAEATIKSAAEKIPAKDAPIVLGQCYEAIGRADEAERQYQKALLTNPVTIATIRHVAEFYLRNGRLERAGDYLRRIADPNNHASPADLAWARRNLAVELAAGGIPQIREGLALIEQNLKSERSSADDQVAKAVILSALPSSRSEAIALFESTFRIKPPSDRDLLMLARAYEANGEWTKARDSMLRLVAAEPVQPLLLDQFVRMLLKRSENSEPGARQGALDEAQVWLGRLEKKDPNSFRTLELRTRLLGAQGRGTEAASLLEKHAQRKKDDVFRVASQLDQLGQARLAEEMYRQCLRETKSAEPTLALADFLGRQGRGPEAIDLCQKALRAGTPAGTVATVAVNAVRQSPRVPEIVKPVERLIENNLNKDPQPIVLLIALAQLRDIQGRYPDSAELYRKVLALDPENVVALNNLAWFLALERTTANEALDLVNRAVKVAGPTGEFLDTKAVAELRLGLTSQAIEDLEGALRQAPTPARYLHLAQAHRDAKNLSDATLAWQTAKKLLKGSSVHPLEKRSYQELAEALGS
jgi:tetratricopeptide (TPR) repeat protein